MLSVVMLPSVIVHNTVEDCSGQYTHSPEQYVVMDTLQSVLG
jgi:hypothetical protein